MGYTLGNPDHVRAFNDGHDHGVDVAGSVEWDDDTARRFINDDTFTDIDPPDPLSGEWGGGPFLTDIAERYGVTLDDHEVLNEICDAYEAGYFQGFHDQATELAHAHLVW